MRWPYLLLALSIVCLVATAVPAMPVQGVCVPWGIELSPKHGPPGTQVTVSGHDFAQGALVDIYYDGTLMASDWTDSRGDFTIRFTIPEGCRGYYEVEADVGYTTVHTYFAVKPALAVSPEKGPVGTTVTVAGRGFDRNEEDIELMYYLNDSYETIQRNITADAKGSWQTTFQVPICRSGEHKLDAEGAVSKHYEVGEAIFRLTAEISLNQSAGIAGDSVTMTGSRFAAYEKGIKVLFAGQAVATGIKANSNGEWQASFQIPEMPAGEYSVSAEGEQTKKEDIIPLSFQIKPEIVLPSRQGHVGMNLTVGGRGFAANKTVDILYDGNPVARASTNDKGTFQTSFAVPQSKHGDHELTARVATSSNSTANLEANAGAIFTMESDPPPTPTLISPAQGSSLGFISEVTPTLEWSGVLDDSGVSYSLQIATSADFSQSSLIVSVEDLPGTSYTPEEALPNGTYYWRVRAVDGAENESGWSTAYSFRVGFLPGWGFIAAIAVGVLLFILVIRALLRRRSIYYDRW